MEKNRIEEIVKQVLCNPQVSYPSISYKITDVAHGSSDDSYTSEYIDMGDFKRYLVRLQERLIYRLSHDKED